VTFGEGDVSLQAVLDRLEGKHVVIIGDVILDEYIWGDVKRISPEAPVPVLEMTSETARFGGAANVAHNVASLSGYADLIGVIGDDSNGTTLVEILQEAGVNTDGICTDSSRPTSTKTRVIARASSTSVSNHQQLVRIDRESKLPVDASLQDELLKTVVNRIPQADALIIEDYEKGVMSVELIENILVEARQYDKPIVVDPKVENFWNYKGVTSITPNHKEAGAALNREITDEHTLIEVGEEILDRLNLEGLLITRGEQGMSLFRRTGDNGRTQVEHICPAHPRDVFDDTGAGDTVVAVFTLALAAHADMFDAARLSNLAGGIVVGEVGCAAATRESLSQAIRLEM
jgi:D-beta-D-heptose 7-phosphate kinase/D-beta-D-heptose 1-phosphate adenosyltransferase